MPYADWAGATRVLMDALNDLADGEFLILGEPSPAPGRRARLLSRQSSRATSRYVQAIRIEGILSAECVGATSLGGTWAMPDLTIEHLRGMGWLTPAETRSAYGNHTPNFELFAEATDAPALAELMLTSLALLGAQPEDLVLQTSGSSALYG